MLRTFGTMLDRISPSSARTLRNIYYTVNGGRIEDLDLVSQRRLAGLKDELLTVDEWRFNDLKDYISLLGRGDGGLGFQVEDSRQRLAESAHRRTSAIAVVSVVPPANTGVANFTGEAFSASDRPVDIFSPFLSVEDYLWTVHHLHATGPLQFFSLTALPFALASGSYDAVVFVLGNSDHHLPICQALRNCRHFRPSAPIYVQIHDPISLNLLDQIAKVEGSDFVQLVRAHASADLLVDWDRARRGDHRELAAAGVTGIRALLNDVPITGLLFHSAAGRDLVLHDWRDLDPLKTHVLFHPVFEKFVPRQPRKPGCLRIGTFGVPGPAKETGRVVDAFRLLQQDFPDAELIIAGYHAWAYANREGLERDNRIVIEEPSSTARLLQLMRSCDVAVQLRALNTGESSGIVPQLLAMDTPVVASATGALKDFGDAVHLVPPGCPIPDLATAIRNEIVDPARRQTQRAAYVWSKTARLFCSQLRDLVAPSASQRAGQSSSAPSISVKVKEPEPVLWADFMKIATEIGADRDDYIQTHMKRFRHTLSALENLALPATTCALEIGTSWIFAILMQHCLGFQSVEVTDFKPGDDRKSFLTELSYPRFHSRITTYNVNLEADELPAPANSYDFVLCCEVLEHFDVDPMFFLSELNRVIRMGGRILLSTPNVTSSRNVMKILRGYAPHFFMQYHRDRSPFRHNIEYAPDQVRALITAAGFRIDKLWTSDTFEEPSLEAMGILADLGFPTGLRGDNVFVVATKDGPVQQRHPPEVYV